MTPHRTPDGDRTVQHDAGLSRQQRRNRLLSAGALAITAVGLVLAAVQPAWIVDPLNDVVRSSGAAAPAVFILLCIVASPAHLGGVLVALSAVVWPLPVAAALSFTGSLLGCLITAGVLRSLGAGPARQRDGWPPWLERLAARVAQRPFMVGLTLRIVVQSGLAVEGFFLLTGYRRSHYLVVTTVGLAVWVAQTLAGVAVLGALVAVRPGSGVFSSSFPCSSEPALSHWLDAAGPPGPSTPVDPVARTPRGATRD